MTNFNPNIKRIEPALTAPALAEGVIGAMSRRMNPRLAWGPIVTFLLGLISGGVIPLLVMQKRFRDFIIAERTHLRHFGEWFRLEFPGVESERLQQSINRLRFRSALFIGAIALTALAITWAWADLSEASPKQISPALLFSFSAQLPKFAREWAGVPRMMLAAEGCTLLLIAAHLLSLWQVVSHAMDIRRVCDLFNLAAKKHGIPPVAAPMLRQSFTGIWLIAAAVSALLGALWGVPMILAGAAQAGYINGSGRAFRLALAGRTFNELASRRPAVDLPMPGALRGKCRRENCEQSLPAGANFCPRCGERAGVR